MTTKKQNQGQYCSTLAFIALNCAVGALIAWGALMFMITAIMLGAHIIGCSR